MTPTEIFQLFGQQVVLLKIAAKSKAPIEQRWPDLTLADMTPAYLATLNGNIGVSLGVEGIGSIDVDDDQWAAQFLALNPKLAGTPISNGARGCNIWIKPTSPPKSHKIKTKDGQPWGEWRWKGNQTVISGTHPSGVEYRTKGGPVIEIDFEEIVWPENLVLPWAPSPPAQPDLHTFLVNKCGAPFQLDQDGQVVRFNQSYFAQRFCLETLVLFELEERRFYLYRDYNGAWQGVPMEIVKKQFKEYYETLCNNVWPGLANQLLPKCTDQFENAIVSNSKAIVGRTKVFKPLKRIIHCANGMLHLDPATMECTLKSFSPDYYSRNAVPVNWEPEAPAPMFDGILSNLPHYDSSLLLRYFGNILLTGNAAEAILIIHGEGGMSKSTLCETIQFLIGEENFIELRTEHLKERFEIARFAGRILLTGKDVSGDFLSSDGAKSLKKLTGHDSQTGEVKGSMERLPIKGQFAVLITCNERLLVLLEGQKDLSAWKRRLLLIEMPPAAKHKEVIDFYAEKMIASEGPGVLFRIVQGAMAHLVELEKKAEFQLSPEQEARVDALLAESQSIEVFLKESVQKGGDGVGTEALCAAYSEFCESRGWSALKIDKVKRELPNYMFALFGSQPSKNISRNKTTAGVRGYLGVSMKNL